MVTMPWLLALYGDTVIRDDDWRPSLGISTGALGGIVFALSKEPMPPRMWILIVVFAAFAVGTPLVLWLRGRNRRIPTG
ncbi:hypothetical protein [Streptomyces cyaneofuscatus]|uniref:hypothetical protein n=1 Tax=Streptomyces cyaneofuscatus TaxID=66883 RepID=UPI003646F803